MGLSLDSFEFIKSFESFKSVDQIKSRDAITLTSLEKLKFIKMKATYQKPTILIVEIENEGFIAVSGDGTRYTTTATQGDVKLNYDESYRVNLWDAK